MKSLNNRGIALITALMLTLITLVIILGIMSIISSNIKSSAANKAYRNVTEASYGGADLLVQDMIPRLFTNQSSGGTSAAALSFGIANNAGLISDYGGSSKISVAFNSNACLQQKLNNSVAGWLACPGDRINPKPNYDMKFSLAGLPGEPGFTVYSKIIDTSVGVPYPSGGNKLLGGGVTESSSGTTSNLNHYVYLIEIQGERTLNPAEKSNLSLLYEY